MHVVLPATCVFCDLVEDRMSIACIAREGMIDMSLRFGYHDHHKQIVRGIEKK